MIARGDREDGYALVAAVASTALFAALALGIMTATRSALIGGGAELEAARTAAAADAGLTLAVDGLLAAAPEQRWLPDGRARRIDFEDIRLSIRIEDESGKVPVNKLDDETVPVLIAAAGLEGERLRIAADSLLDWIDDDDEPRAEGAEADYYRAAHIQPRNGPLQTIGELGHVRGFDPALVDRLRPFITVYGGQRGFDARFAQPRAIGVMEGSGEDSTAAIIRARELAGQQTAFAQSDAIDITRRPLTIDVEARTAAGARSRMVSVIELTGDAYRPYVVLSVD